MKKMIFAVLMVAIFFSCKGTGSSDREGLFYDKFRGDDSSIINLTQYESLSMCLQQFDFSRYQGAEITYALNAPNDFVSGQLDALMRSICEKNNIRAVSVKYDERGNRPGTRTEKYDLQVNAVCGGYYFYDGLLLKNYKSITRLIMAENEIEKKKIKNYDSGYREYQYATLEFTDIFKVFLYSLILLVIAVVLVKFVLLKTKKPNLK
jgi:hypothetical protein